MPEDRRESAQGAGISTHANHLGIHIGPTINLFSDMPEDNLANHNLQNPERFGFAHEPAAYVRAKMTTGSNDQNPNNGHALTPAGVQHTSYPHRPAVKYSNINTESDPDVSRMTASNYSSTRYSPESLLRSKTYRRMEGKASENLNMETSIGSEIMRDEQSIAPRWATKWKMLINQNKKVNEAFAEKPTSLLLGLKAMEGLSDNDLVVILRPVTAIGSDD